MSSVSTCFQCGTPRPPINLVDLCPYCLFQLAADDSLASRALGLPDRLLTAGELNRRLGEFEVLKLVGNGGMGAVYQAVQKSLGRMVAIKVLSIQRGQDPMFLERFVQEARALGKLCHPNIVRAYDANQKDDFLYIAMEYVDGTTLRDLIRSGQLDVANACRLMVQICKAIQYAHHCGVIHRDLKPENILIDSTNSVRIADFGLAKLGSDYSAELFNATGKNARMGTYLYMAPEQRSDSGRVDGRSDIYSLGVVFYEMLTGRLPTADFSLGTSVSATNWRLRQIVLTAIRERPEQRYQSADEMISALKKVTNQRTRHLRAYLTIAATVLLVAASTAALAMWGAGHFQQVEKSPEGDIAPSAPAVNGPSKSRFSTQSYDASQREVAAWVFRMNGGVEYRAGESKGVARTLDALPQHPLELTVLGFGPESPLTDEQLLHLHPLSHLESLWLHAPAITDEAVQHLRAVRSLRFVSFNGTRVSGTGLVHLAQLPNLAVIRIDASTCLLRSDELQHLSGNPRLVELTLVEQQLKDDDLRHLAQLFNLRVLSLRDNPLSDRALIHLEPLDKLDSLDIRGTQITQEGIQQFLESHPHCKVLK